MADGIADFRGTESSPAAREIAALTARLGELQLAQIAHQRRAIILFEGLEGSAKKFALRQLVGALDPCHVAVHSHANGRGEVDDGHWLARFWSQLPAAGGTAIFFRGWYRRVLDDRLRGWTPAPGLLRAFDEINEFEAQQRDYGTMLIKFYFDVSADVQQQRIERKRMSPWLSCDGDFIQADDPAFQRAVDELRLNTDTRWSPWRTIDGDDEQQAALAVLKAVVETWSKALPSDPPKRAADPPPA